MLGKYTSIDNHYKSVGDMLGLPAVASEKIDGSNFSVHLKRDGTHEFRSRNQTVNEHEGSMFAPAIILVEGKVDELRHHLCLGEREAIVYFELFGQGIQKRINYEKYIEKCSDFINGKSVALIDGAYLPTEKGGHRDWLTLDEIEDLADVSGFWTPPQKHIARLTMADIENMLAEKDTEGYVLHTVDEDGRRVRNSYGDMMMVKVKTDWYTSYEKNGPKDKKAKPKTPPEIIDFLLDRVNYGRLHSVYSHGFDMLKREMSDMRYLPTLVLGDIRDETEGHEIWDQFEEKAIRKVIAHMLPRVMKSWFLEESVK